MKILKGLLKLSIYSFLISLTISSFGQAGLGVSAKDDGGVGGNCRNTVSIIIDLKLMSSICSNGAFPFAQNNCEELYLTATSSLTGLVVYSELADLMRTGTYQCGQKSSCVYEYNIELLAEDLVPCEPGNSFVADLTFTLTNSNGQLYNFSCFDLCGGSIDPVTVPIVRCCASDLGSPFGSNRNANENQDEVKTMNFNNIDNQLQIEIISREGKSLPLSIFDLQGRQVKSLDLNIVNGINQHTIDMNDLNRGIYISHLLINGKRETFKFVVSY